MKKNILYQMLFFTAFLMACSGSETYRGNWKAMDEGGNKFEIIFDAKNFTVQDSLGKQEKYEYTQNSINIKNNMTTYGIQLGDGRGYEINFPNSANKNTGLIKDENGMPLYTISRNDYVNYEDVYKLN